MTQGILEFLVLEILGSSPRMTQNSPRMTQNSPRMTKKVKLGDDTRFREF